MFHGLQRLLNLSESVCEILDRRSEEASGGDGGVEKRRALRVRHLRERKPQVPLSHGNRGHVPPYGLCSGFSGAKGETTENAADTGARTLAEKGAFQDLATSS